MSADKSHWYERFEKLFFHDPSNREGMLTQALEGERQNKQLFELVTCLVEANATLRKEVATLKGIQ